MRPTAATPTTAAPRTTCGACCRQLAAGGGVDALVLDLRGDGGGYLPEAIGLTHLFINHGPVVQLRDTTGQLEVLDEPDPGQAYAGPLAVLVDRTSASASEIFCRRDPGLSSRPDHRSDHASARARCRA